MSDLAPYWPAHTNGWPEDAELVDWYRSTLDNLIGVIESMSEDHRCLTFLPAPASAPEQNGESHSHTKED
mgnify:CR=1 FL=1